MTEAQVMLREVEEGDLLMLMNHRNDWSTRRWLENCRPVTAEDQKRWFSTLSRQCRIATVDGEPVGLARISPNGPEAYSVGCDVFSQHRGKGLGHRVFEASCQRAIDFGGKLLSLWVFCDNEPAVKIYKRAGFHWDHSAAVKFFYRPVYEVGEHRPWVYARMEKIVS